MITLKGESTLSKVTISEVAHLAGVSTATVSHVINNTRYVSDETRRRVQDSIEQLGYNPNIMARIFKTGKKYLIGFVVPDISNIFLPTLLKKLKM